ncbi:MAG: TRAP transporter substrate-binding protein [Eubacteriales bacterium]|nr:TRAP transporter substrate-binding protein [Eubacteriales bacterium]
MKKKVASAVVFLVLVVLIAGCLGKRKAAEIIPEYVFTYAENQAEDYPTTMGAKKFSELVYERTNGKIIIQIKSGGELGEEGQVIRQMQFGGIDFARISLTTMSDVIPRMNVLQMPYLYEDSEHMWRVLDGEIGEEFLGLFTAVDLVALSWYDAGARSFYSKSKRIRKLEDLQGMVVRVQESALMKDMVRALGGIPYTNAFSAVYSAFETGKIDAAENNWPSYESTGHWKVAGYFTVDEHTRVPEVQLCSARTWKQLSTEYQDIIRECARESALYERELWNEREEEARRKVLEQGCEEILPDAEEIRKFQEAVEPIYEKYCSDYMDDINKIKNSSYK